MLHAFYALTTVQQNKHRLAERDLLSAESFTSVQIGLATTCQATSCYRQSQPLPVKRGDQPHCKPQMHPEMSAQPYYFGFVLDPDGNNIEAVSFCGKWNGQP